MGWDRLAIARKNRTNPSKAADQSDSDIRAFQVVYEAVTCDVCGDTVPVTRTCGCRAWQPRPDKHVAARIQGLSGLSELLSLPSEPSEPIEISEAVAQLSPWIADLFQALNNAGSPSGDAEGVRASVDALVSLRRRVAAVPRRRPWLAVWTPLSEALNRLAEMAVTYLDAATQASPDAAQPLEAVAQRQLDQAAISIQVLDARLKWWGTEGSIRLPHLIVRSASDAYEMTNARNVIDLDAFGHHLYTRISGRTEAPAGIGVGLLLDIGQANQAFDEERLYHVARLVYKRLANHRDQVLRLLDDPGWRKDILEARRVFYEARLSASVVLEELAGERRIEIKALLELGARLTERVSATLLGLLLAAGPGRSLKRTVDYKSVHQAARQAGLHELLGGFDEHIRQASAHEDFEVFDDHVTLCTRRGPALELTDDELIDVVLMGLESSAGLFAGLDCVLAELDHPSVTDRVQDLRVEDQVKIVLAACGVHPTRAAVTADRLMIAGTSMPSTALRPLTVIASLTPFVPEEIGSCDFELDRPDRVINVWVDLALMRTFLRAEGFLKEIAFLEFLANVSINKSAMFPRRHVRYMAAWLAYRHIHTPVAAALEDLRALAELADRLRDSDLAESLRAYTSVKAANERGLPAGEHMRKTLRRLAAYGGTPPGPWDDGGPPSDGITSSAA